MTTLGEKDTLRAKICSTISDYSCVIVESGKTRQSLSKLIDFCMEQHNELVALLQGFETMSHEETEKKYTEILKKTAESENLFHVVFIGECK